MMYSISSFLALALATFSCAQTHLNTSIPGNGTTTPTSYTNPILDGVAADPWVIGPLDDQFYYLLFTLTDNITLYRSKSLTDWNNADQKLLFKPKENEDYSTDLWAPEIHHDPTENKWYVIFTADPNGDEPSPAVDMFCSFSCPAVHHRMYTLESSGSGIWTSDYKLKTQLNTYDQFAIDGTYFRYENSLYHVYSCWYSAYESWPANLCITEMSNPYTVTSNLTTRTVISSPTEPWEKTPYGRQQNVRLSSNEGPQQLTSPITGQQFIIYSAARSDNANYCLGQLSLKMGGDPMNAQDWVKYPGCVFYQNKRERAVGVGHASFVQSPDEKEWWIVYHGMLDPTNGWTERTLRAQKFTWNDDGSPNFPRPGYGPYPLPSGQ